MSVINISINTFKLLYISIYIYIYTIQYGIMPLYPESY